MSDFIYLASQSPRRRQLLEQMGVAHRLLLPDNPEAAEALEAQHPNEPPAVYVQRVTALKLDAALAQLARTRCPEAPVLCADTTVALGRTILGKPQSAEQACAMLAALAGRRHRVLTAVVVGHAGQRWQALSESWVQFAPLTPAQIDRYVASGEPMGKAGAYGIQGRAATFVHSLRGSYSGIMGLPLFETAQLLTQCGWHFPLS